MEELVNLGKVQHFIGPEEEEVNGIASGTLSLTQHVVSIVHSKGNPNEWSVFVFKQERETLEFEHIFPLFSDTKVISNDCSFEISHTSDDLSYLHHFEAPSIEAATEISAEITKAIASAKQWNGIHFEWLKKYQEKGAVVAPTPISHSSDLKTSKGIKSEWINNQLKARESEYSKMLKLSIFLGTFNVNSAPPSEPLYTWLTDPNRQHDIIAVGFQELDFTATSYLFESTLVAWERHVNSTLSLQGEYVRVITKQLMGVVLCVYVQREHIPHVADIQADVVGVGIMGMIGNKGGVAIRFSMYDSTICIVNSHLNAHSENVARRNQDMKDIARRAVFHNDHGAVYSIYEHDMLFWIGDLNYRIDLEDAFVREKAAEGDWNTLVQADQLCQQMRSGFAFEGFREGPITFAPTYKYDVGTTNYDTSEKHRTPAYCDRVLWWEGMKNIGNIGLIAYNSHEIHLSDHKPVSASFNIQVKAHIPEKRAQVYQDIVKELDKLESEFVDPPEVNTPPTLLSKSKDEMEVGLVATTTPAASGGGSRSIGSIWFSGICCAPRKKKSY